MKLTSGLICMLALFFLLACNNGGEKANVSTKDSSKALSAEQIEQFGIVADAIVNYQAYPTGDTLRFWEVLECARMYDSVMRAHGFDTARRSNRTITTTQTEKITHSVDFADAKLLKFLADELENLRGNSKDIQTGIKLVLGMYTPEFIARHKLKDTISRISIFVVPVKRGDTIILNKSHAPMTGTIEGTRLSYNLGGVSP